MKKRTKKDPREETRQLIRRVFNQIEEDDIWDYVTSSVEANVISIAKDIKDEEDFIECGAYSYQKADSRKTIAHLKRLQVQYNNIASCFKEITAARTKIKKLDQ